MLADALSSNPGSNGAGNASSSLVLVSDPWELPPRSDTLTFVRQNSPDGDSDLLPGLCLFTERWLTQVRRSFLKEITNSSTLHLELRTLPLQ